MFEISGKQVRTFNLLSPDAPAALFLECHFWGNGLAAISTESFVYVAEVRNAVRVFNSFSIILPNCFYYQGFSALEIATRGPRVYLLRTGLGMERSYTSMTIIPPQLTGRGLLEVLLGTSDNSILVLYETDSKNVAEDQQLQNLIEAPIVKMAVAPNGVFLACYRSDGVLTVMTAALSRKVLTC